MIQPAAQIAQITHAAGGWLHLDAVQALGKIALNFAETGADTLSLSAHKIGGPQGVGALAAGTGSTLARRQHGGGQERGRRGGTENVSGIAGFGAAARAAGQALTGFHEQAAWRDAAQARLENEACVTVFGAGAPRLPNVLCFAAEGLTAERQVIALDLDGVMISAGAACSSGKVAASPVITAMGHMALAPCALRVSGGWNTSEADWARFAGAWLALSHRLRAGKRASAA